ncbi:MAG: phage holin family protein [Actinobacteria bacterium]|nr:phage holin family protein [Actinomycetota bacterium]
MASTYGGQPAEQEQSTGELVSQLSEQMSRLVRDEMKLARLEMTRKGKEAGLGAGLLGGSGIITLYAIGCLLACVIIAISGAVAAWLAALIVGVALLAVAGIAALIGRSRLNRATPPVPTEATGSVRADIEEIREKAHR